MKLILISMLGISLLYSHEYKLKPIVITKGVYCFFGNSEEINIKNGGNISNSCFVDMGKSYLVIDSGSTKQYAQQATQAIQKIANKPISHLINTHSHDDHWLGNSYFKELNPEMMGSYVFDTLSIGGETRIQRLVSKDAYAGTSEVLPSTITKESKKFDIDGTSVELKVYQGKSHSQGDMVVAIPSKHILFAGDLVFNDRMLSIRDGEISNWIKALEDIEKHGYKHIVGGHGIRHDDKATQTTKEYLKDAKSYVNSCLKSDIDILSCVQKSDMKKYMHLKLYSDLHKKNIESIYRTMEWENEQ